MKNLLRTKTSGSIQIHAILLDFVIQDVKSRYFSGKSFSLIASLKTYLGRFPVSFR